MKYDVNIPVDKGFMCFADCCVIFYPEGEVKDWHHWYTDEKTLLVFFTGTSMIG